MPAAFMTVRCASVDFSAVSAGLDSGFGRVERLSNSSASSQAPRLESRDHAIQRFLPPRQMHEQQPHVHQIEGRLWKWILKDVVAKDAQVREPLRIQVADVDVGGEHVAARSTR
jgi:hypothetical protein